MDVFGTAPPCRARHTCCSAGRLGGVGHRQAHLHSAPASCMRHTGPLSTRLLSGTDAVCWELNRSSAQGPSVTCRSGGVRRKRVRCGGMRCGRMRGRPALRLLCRCLCLLAGCWAGRMRTSLALLRGRCMRASLGLPRGRCMRASLGLVRGGGMRASLALLGGRRVRACFGLLALGRRRRFRVPSMRRRRIPRGACRLAGQHHDASGEFACCIRRRMRGACRACARQF